MTCPIEQDLTAYLDGELAAGRVGEMEQHLATCDACATLVGTWVQLGDAIRKAPMDKPSLSAQSRWINSVTALSADRSVRRLAGWMTAAASIILAATLTISFSNQAQATPTINDWEAAAIAGPEASNDLLNDSSGDSSHATARLLAVDLSLPSQNEGSR